MSDGASSSLNTGREEERGGKKKRGRTKIHPDAVTLDTVLLSRNSGAMDHFPIVKENKLDYMRGEMSSKKQMNE